MAKLRHVAIICEDLEQATKFYTTVFDLVEVGRVGQQPGDTADVVHLSDGVVNVDIYRPKDPSHPDDQEPYGLNHIGFVVTDIKDAVARAETLGATMVVDQRISPDQDMAEIWGVRMKSPDGVAFDFTQTGYAGAVPDPGAGS